MQHNNRHTMELAKQIEELVADNDRLRSALTSIAAGDILPLPLPENFGAFYHTALDQRDIARKAITA